MSRVIRVRYERSSQAIRAFGAGEGEEVDIVIKCRVFGEDDYRKVRKFIEGLPRAEWGCSIRRRSYILRRVFVDANILIRVIIGKEYRLGPTCFGKPYLRFTIIII